VLAFFKYDRLLAATFLTVPPGHELEVKLAIPLPIGISFYTYDGISLLVDVFRARQSGDVRGPLGQERGFFNLSIRTLFLPDILSAADRRPHRQGEGFLSPGGRQELWRHSRVWRRRGPDCRLLPEVGGGRHLAQQTFVLQPPYCFSQPPAPLQDAVRQLTGLQQATMARRQNLELLRRNLSVMKMQLERLRARGIRVGFFEMPTDPRIYDSSPIRDLQNSGTPRNLIAPLCLLSRVSH
jgi:hypothetical protein